MASLDPKRIQLFAKAKGASSLEGFLGQIEKANLWRFARRPIDLDGLVEFWQTKGRLGSLAEMLENSIAERVRSQGVACHRTDWNGSRIRAEDHYKHSRRHCHANWRAPSTSATLVG